MTNEELATAIQTGKTELYAPLWAQVKGIVLLWMLSLFHRYSAQSSSAGVTLDDLEQEGFLALMDALKIYDPSRGKLTTCLKYPVCTRFFAAIGARTSRREPLNGAASLNLPAGEDGDSSLLDLLPDPLGESALEEAQENIYTSQLRKDLEICLNMIPAKQAQTLRAIYFQGETLAAIGEKEQVSTGLVHRRKLDGLRSMQRGKCLSILKSYRENIISSNAYHGGWTSYRNSRTSSTERTVERLLEL